MLGPAAVSAQQLAVGIRPDHRQRLELARIERQRLLVVLEQRDRLARRFERELAILVAANQFFRDRRIDVRIFKQPQPEFV